jgi:uncharacterized protein (DUF58 family)
MWDKQLTVDIRFAVTDTFEGRTIGFREHVWNGKRLPMPYVNTTYVQSAFLKQTDLSGKEIFAGTDRSVLVVVPGKRHVQRKSLIVCSKRGYYTIKKAMVMSSDLFFLRTFMKDIELNSHLTVYPREIEVSDIDIPFKRMCGEVLTKRYILPDPFEFIGVREYQPFDSFRQINFNAWAKTGQPMSNIYGYTVSQEVRIALNLGRYSFNERGIVHENAIRLAAFFARKYLEAGIPVSFVTNGLDCITNAPGKVEKGQTSRHLREVYEILARVDIDRNGMCRSIVDFLPEEQDLRTEGMVVVLISTCTDESICAWYEAAKKSAADILWVAPVYKGDKREAYGGGVVVWEVEDD